MNTLTIWTYEMAKEKLSISMRHDIEIWRRRTTENKINKWKKKESNKTAKQLNEFQKCQRWNLGNWFDRRRQETTKDKTRQSMTMADWRIHLPPSSQHRDKCEWRIDDEDKKELETGNILYNKLS